MMDEIRLIENDRMQLEISDVGAEPQTIWDKERKRSALWRGDPRYWKRRAPILFPNVGTNYHNEYRFDGHVYPTSQHGFARDRIFTCVEQSGDRLVHQLVDDDATMESYPFPFMLTVTHRLEGDRIVVEWQVKNTGSGPMYFTIGGHPAFALLKNALDKKNYYLEFPDKTQLTYTLIDPGEGNPLPDNTFVMELDDHRLALSDELFAKDALIFDGGQIETVALYKNDGEPLVRMDAPGFPNFGIWSVEGAPFVCLEPWIGRTDDAGFTGDLSKKPGITQVEAGDEFSASYSITLL